MQLNSEMASMTDSGAITGMDAREDGVYITYIPSTGADAVTKKLGEPDIQSKNFSTSPPSNGTVSTFDLTSIPNYNNLVLWKNLFPVYNATIYHPKTDGSGGGTIRWAYNAETGRLTFTTSGTLLVKYGTGSLTVSCTVYYYL